MSFSGSINTEYAGDLRRGRHEDCGARFYDLAKFAHARWMKSRDPHHYDHWRKIMEAVERRK